MTPSGRPEGHCGENRHAGAVDRGPERDLGRRHLPEPERGQDPGAGRPRPGGETLNQRERTVLLQIAKGLSNEAIAIKLGISAAVAEEHRASLIKKTGLLSQTELTRLGAQLGLIQAG